MWWGEEEKEGGEEGMQTRRRDSLYPLEGYDARALSMDGKRETLQRSAEASSKDASAGLASREKGESIPTSGMSSSSFKTPIPNQEIAILR